MTREEARIKYESILDEHNEKVDLIIQKAKAEGRWAMGLDSNRELFIELEKETKQKISQLCEQIDA